MSLVRQPAKQAKVTISGLGYKRPVGHIAHWDKFSSNKETCAKLGLYKQVESFYHLPLKRGVT